MAGPVPNPRGLKLRSLPSLMNQSLWRSAPATYAMSFTFDFLDSTISMNTQEFSKSHSSESQMQHAVSLERPADS